MLGQIEPPNGDSLSINNVRAWFASDGTLDFNQNTGEPMYQVPKTSGLSSIFCGALWIGGLDVGGKLHTAAATYRQNGNDFWPGPVMNSSNYSAQQDTIWNRLYKVTRSTVDSLKAGYYNGKVPKSILDWPGNGDVSKGQMPQLAPYFDGNSNGIYDPDGGPNTDYPLIRGDQAIYMIYNDDRGPAHTESGGTKFGFEVHLMSYQFTSADSALSTTTFLHYDIYDRSASTYKNVYLGNFVDMNISALEYVGADTTDSFWYTYSSSPADTFILNSNYGNYPPAQALAYLCDTMKHFIFYYNDFTNMGNPWYDTMYYNYMQSTWGDGKHLTYGDSGRNASNPNTNFAYTGDPLSGIGWSEVSAKQPSGDMRGVSSIGPFTFTPGGSKSFDIALVFAQSPDLGGNLQSVELLKNYVADVKAFYSSQSYGCDSGLLGINELTVQNGEYTVFPNPTKGIINFKSTSREQLLAGNYVEIYNILGEKVLTQKLTMVNSQFSIDLNNNPAGLYMYRVLTEKGVYIANGKIMLGK